MCGIQIGAQELDELLAHKGESVDSAQGICGVQIGAAELDKIRAHMSEGGREPAGSDCGIQIGEA